MSLTRASAPFASQAIQLLRASQSQTLSRAPLCPQCLRNLHSASRIQQERRRHFAAPTAFRPQSLETHTPPRNSGIPETSIAGGNAKVDGASAFQGQQHQSDNPPASHEASIPEYVAQTTQPTGNAASGPGSAVGSVAAPEPAPGKSKRPKLRPRKAAMSLTPAAVTQLRELLNQPDPKLIRVGVKNKGCSGLAYHLEYVDTPGKFDEAVDQDGVKVLVDSKALFSIIGSEMDWIEDKLSRRFVFKNPNITEQCGCGESFSIS